VTFDDALAGLLELVGQHVDVTIEHRGRLLAHFSGALALRTWRVAAFVAGGRFDISSIDRRADIAAHDYAPSMRHTVDAHARWERFRAIIGSSPVFGAVGV
jgi:hypothetical protein